MKGWRVSLALLAAVGCNNSADGGKPKPTPRPVATATSGAVDEVDQASVVQDAAVALGEKLAQIYQTARPKVTKVGGSVRYWSFGAVAGIEIAAALAEDSHGFKQFEYSADCSVAEPSPICALKGVFEIADVEAATELVRKIDPETTIVLRAAGKADAVWKDPKVPRVYDGQCGEAECAAGEGKLQLRAPLPVKSNQVLACLRALCTQALTGLKPPLVKPELRGLVVESGGAAASDRRAEVSIFVPIPVEQRRIVWDVFLRALGHR